MPLHLLGKKSWNVYNPENIARVQRDEAQAKAQEKEEELRMQEVDAERRIQILRGERPSTPPPPASQPSSSKRERKHNTDYNGGHKRRRRLAGENDTDRDIRFAREDAEVALAKRQELGVAQKNEDDSPLHDSDGHINLFPERKKGGKRVEKNPEAEIEAADKQRRHEDQYKMRFSNAAGFRQDIGKKPWYSSRQASGMASEAIPSKDVWGNEDPLRKEREKARMSSNDPLLAIKKGVRQLKAVEEGRKQWNQERSRELDALKLAEKVRSRHRRRRSRSKDSLDDFRLDESPDRSRTEKSQRPDKHHRHSNDKNSGHSSKRHSRSRPRSQSHRHRRVEPDGRRHTTNTNPGH
ncbi:hypothetical protein BJX70DRAFT_131675 [Aspergillus crustosus]